MDETPSDLRELSSKSPAIWRVENALGVAAAWALGAGAYWGLSPSAPWTYGGGAALVMISLWGVLEGVVLVPLRYRYYRYALTADYLVVDRGYLWRRRRVYPLSRILYCEIRQGILLRRFDLYRVKMSTLVETHPVGPLSRAEANRFEEYLRRSEG